MAKIQLNGKKTSIKSNFSLLDLLKKYKLMKKKVAIELNGRIVSKTNYKKKYLKNNDKVEIVQSVGPAKSDQALEDILNHAESLLKKLDLPYRVVQLCAGDLGFSSYKTYDLEVWMPNQEKYREISSCSNFLDFQARRSKIRSKDQNSSTFLHTLNGSALAVGRTLIAIVENYFDEKSNKILIPECLISHFGDHQIIL